MSSKINLVIDQGTSYVLYAELNDEAGNPISNTDYTPTAKLRKHWESANAITFTSTLSNVGVLSLSLTPEQTQNLNSGKYVYDVLLTDSQNNVIRIFEGIATLTPEVSKWLK